MTTSKSEASTPVNPSSTSPNTARAEAASAEEMVTITIDGKPVEVPKGELLIKAAQEHGTYIPRFCWHERMKPVGMCRMCLVEIEGVRGLPPACTTPVADGMAVTTMSENVKAVQDGVLELLLINHPLDCPVCDRGGECPLQDTTLAFGPGESRFAEEKRHWEKPIALSDLVLLDRERCIQCARCTRFADEIAGDPLITFSERGGHTEIATFPDTPFASYFSGNTVQICPVGALTSKPYRFRARPWDLAAVETSCTTCAVQCRGALESSSNRLVRLLGVDSEPVNQGWLCDKGRYGYEAVHHESRVVHPMVRRGGELVECSWPEALDAAADALRDTLATRGSSSIAVLGGARGTNEDAYVWARFAKAVLRTDNVDAQMGDGLPAEVALGLPHATIADLDRARAIVVLGIDVKEELPVLYLRARRAAVELGVPLIEVTPAATGLAPYAAASLRYAPGEQGAVVADLVAALQGTGGGADVAAAAAAVAGRDGDLVVVAGRGNLAESVDATVDALAAFAGVDGAHFLVALRRGNVRGALDLGLAPGFLPGRVTLEDGREWFEDHWGALPGDPGLDGLGILGAAGRGEIDTLVLLGADPLSDCPDRALAAGALEGAAHVIAVDTFLTDSTRTADVFLPVTTWGEQDGTVSNVEGRVQRVARKVTADGTAMPDWRVAAELALRLREDFDLATADEVQDEIARVAPAFAGVTSSLLRRARDGAVLPVAEHEDELVLGRLSIPLTDASWAPIAPGQVDGADPTAIEAVESAAAETAADGDVDGGTDASSAATSEPAGVARPELHRWSPAAPTPNRPGRDAYALRLVSGRTLYDGGVLVGATPAFSPLVRPAELLISQHDRDRIGAADGDPVRVTSARGQLELPVRAVDGVVPGTAVLPWNLPGALASALVDASGSVTDLRVESVPTPERTR
ncbi:MAG: NADH-quinone oxidoreductase subunit NuoG [Acidimicrobiia bacterium]